MEAAVEGSFVRDPSGRVVGLITADGRVLSAAAVVSDHRNVPAGRHPLRGGADAGRPLWVRRRRSVLPRPCTGWVCGWAGSRPGRPPRLDGRTDRLGRVGRPAGGTIRRPPFVHSHGTGSWFPSCPVTLRRRERPRTRSSAPISTARRYMADESRVPVRAIAPRSRTRSFDFAYKARHQVFLEARRARRRHDLTPTASPPRCPPPFRPRC